MSSSTSSRSRAGTHRSGARGGGGDFHGGEGGGGGGGGGGGDRLVKVAYARSEPEAELIQGLLLDAGIPSVLQRVLPWPTGTYMPGPAEVMVTEALAPRARQVLAETLVESEEEERRELEEERRLLGKGGPPSPAVLAFWLFAAALGAFGLVWVLYQLT